MIAGRPEWFPTIPESVNTSYLPKFCEALHKQLLLKLTKNFNPRAWGHTSMEAMLEQRWNLGNWLNTSPVWILFDEKARKLAKMFKLRFQCVFDHREIQHYQESLFGLHVYWFWIQDERGFTCCIIPCTQHDRFRILMILDNKVLRVEVVDKIWSGHSDDCMIAS